MKNVLDLYCRKKAQYEKTLDPLHDYGFYGFVYFEKRRSDRCEKE